MKHISPKFSYTHELKKSGEINVQQIRSNDNLTYLFTKSLPTSTFKKLIYNIEICQSKNIDMRGEYTYYDMMLMYYTFFSFVQILSH